MHSIWIDDPFKPVLRCTIFFSVLPGFHKYRSIFEYGLPSLSLYLRAVNLFCVPSTIFISGTAKNPVVSPNFLVWKF